MYHLQSEQERSSALRVAGLIPRSVFRETLLHVRGNSGSHPDHAHRSPDGGFLASRPLDRVPQPGILRGAGQIGAAPPPHADVVESQRVRREQLT